MASKSFKSISELNAYLQKQIDSTLNLEVSAQVKEEIQTSVSETVYSAGTPLIYPRRGGNEYGGMGNSSGTGSLGDPEEMHHTVTNGVLMVTDDAQRNRDFNSFPGVGYDESKSLAENIEFGWGNKEYWFNKERPFMEKTVENMKSSQSHILVMKDGLRKRGLDVV